MNKKPTALLLSGLVLLASCKKSLEPLANEEKMAEISSPLADRPPYENPASFALISSTDIGDAGAAEISAYDPRTKKLFVVNNTSNNNRIDVLNFADPTAPQFLTSIPVAPFGGLVNSLAVYDGKLAAAIEASTKTDNGKAVIFRTTDYSVIKQVTVGALPDMITYSPDGDYIITANEGEPNADYSIDPIGTVSIISVERDYAVTTLDFSAFAAQEDALKAKGLRKFGPNASFAQDMEPEYVTVSSDSKTAWVTLQENNTIAKIDLRKKMIVELFPLGFKNYSLAENAIDPSDRPLGTISFNAWPVFGIYMPDAIAVLDNEDEMEGDDDHHDNDRHHRIPYLFTANEGDARDYSTFTEEVRIGASSVVLDPVLFPNAATLKLPENLGRLNITKTMGNTDADAEYEKLYSLGARSFSVWNGNTGALLFDSKNELEKKAQLSGFYDDDRSDNKGVEPEGITLGKVNKRNLVFVGMERADAVAIYDVSNPLNPQFLQILATGDAPEGVLFIPAKYSPNRRSLLVVSSENDGVIKVYMPSSN
jgi:hypothetical protein